MTAALRHRSRCPLAVRQRAPSGLASLHCWGGVCARGGRAASTSRPCSITGSRLRTAPLLAWPNRSFLGFVPLQGPSGRQKIPLLPSARVRRPPKGWATRKLRSAPAVASDRSRRRERAALGGEPRSGGAEPEGWHLYHRRLPKGAPGRIAHRERPKPFARASNQGSQAPKCARRVPDPVGIPSTVHRTRRVHRTVGSRRPKPSRSREARRTAGEPVVDRPPVPSKSVQS